MLPDKQLKDLFKNTKPEDFKILPNIKKQQKKSHTLKHTQDKTNLNLLALDNPLRLICC